MFKIIGADQAQYGPIPVDQLKQWIAEGRADANTPAQREGTTEWRPLRELPEFAGDFAAPPVRPGAGGPAYPPPLPPPPMAPPGSEPVPDYLVYSILCTLCCCLPTGIVALVYSSKVNDKLRRGDYEGAQAASRNARLWCWVSFGLGIPAMIVGVIIELAMVGANAFPQ